MAYGVRGSCDSQMPFARDGVFCFGDPKGYSINQQAEELPQTLVLRRHPGHCWLFPG